MNIVNKFKEAVESNLTQEKIIEGSLKFFKAIAIIVICLVIIKIGEKIIHSFLKGKRSLSLV
ncbi:hypothetical protein PL321_08345 [Caloramator sp. mosi_1]|uniref:hypothetical protein n=1 Tax=Caloramator sp. mosi_1 TaxID=3023090 RepID=UPI00235DF49A|nr:hypothetical protein [Caloramator sp. mosi_1]WDC85361.1 hypothetical protein PL321_08345 [Caloramator sp. mosi_1]